MRLCGAVGLHHMIYPLFWYTELGGVEVVAGQTVAGAQKIFFAQLADPTHVGLFTEGTRFFAGRFLYNDVWSSSSLLSNVSLCSKRSS